MGVCAAVDLHVFLVLFYGLLFVLFYSGCLFAVVCILMTEKEGVWI